MAFEATLRTALLNHAALAALVGTRIYADSLEQGAVAAPNVPAVVVTRVTTGRETALPEATIASRPRFRFTCWASSKSGALDLAAAVRDALAQQVRPSVKSVLLTDERGWRESESSLWRQDIDATILHEGE